MRRRGFAGAEVLLVVECGLEAEEAGRDVRLLGGEDDALPQRSCPARLLHRGQ